MNYPCKLIQDLLPLYHDGVCSSESKEIIEEHLSECKECSDFYAEIRDSDALAIPVDSTREIQKAASLKTVKKRILRKQILIIAAALIVFAALIFGLFAMESTVDVMKYKKENITVSMIDGELIAHLHGGNQFSSMYLKNVPAHSDSGEKYYMFVCVYQTRWNKLTARFSAESEALSNRVLAYKDKGAGSIERVYYYTGDSSGIEMLSEEELQNVIEESVLLWSRE